MIPAKAEQDKYLTALYPDPIITPATNPTVKGARTLARSSPLVPWQRNLWSTVIAELLTLLGFTSGSILVPYYVQQMGVTGLRQVGAWTGAYQSAGAVAFALATPIWGALGDRYGRKLMLVRAMGSAAMVLALMGLARTPTQLMILRVIQGCLTGTPAAASALLATGTPRERLGYALGLLQTSVLVGSSVGPMFGGYIADALGYRAAFYVAAVVVFAATLLVLLAVREPVESTVASAQARRENPLAGFRSLLRLPRLVLLIGLVLVINLTYGLLGPVLPLYIQQLVTNPSRLASTAGTISGIAAFTGAAAALIIGRLSDRLGHRRVLLSCLGGMTLLYFPQALARSATMLGFFLGLQGFFQGGLSPSTSALVVGSAPKEKVGAALGLSSSASSTGYALGPILGALVMGATTPRTVYFIAGGIFTLVTLSVAASEIPALREAFYHKDTEAKTPRIVYKPK
jgi:DHA1 family multidrug resistance protein-like MFS transporter